MPIPQRSRFTYGLGEEFITQLPPRAWMPAEQTIGGERTSEAGIAASYIARTDVLLDVTLRFFEDEYEDVRALIRFGQTKQGFLWFPDAEDVVSFLVYLDAPKVGERWAPTRDGQFPRVFEQAITLRGVGAVEPWLRYWPAD